MAEKKAEMGIFDHNHIGYIRKHIKDAKKYNKLRQITKRIIGRKEKAFLEFRDKNDVKLQQVEKYYKNLPFYTEREGFKTKQAQLKKEELERDEMKRKEFIIR